MAGGIKGITIELEGNTTKLDKAIDGVAKSANKAQGELRKIEQMLKFNPNNTVLLAQKQEMLSQKVQATSDKLKILKNAEADVQAQFARGDIKEEQYREFQRELVKTESQLKQYKSELKDVSKHQGDFFNKMAGASKKIGDVGQSLMNTGQTLTRNVTMPLLGLGAYSFKMAADVSDAMGAVDQIFKGSAKNVQDWADKLPAYYGIAKGEALSYSSTMGAMLQNIGGLTEAEAAKQSATLVELAGDLSAMFGGTTESAVQALTGALKGNTSMLDNYGMGVNDATIKAKALEMGIYDGTGALDLQSKQAATLALIMEQTADAQGQAAREAEGASGSWKTFTTELKNLAIAIGEVLLPIITPLIQKMAEWVGKFKEMSPESQKLIVIIGMIVAAIGPLLMILGGLAMAISFILTPVGLVVAGITAAVAIIIAIFMNWSAIVEWFKGVWNVFCQANIVMFNMLVNGIQQGWANVKAKTSELASSMSAKFEEIKAAAHAKFDAIKTGITNKINAAKQAVKDAVDRIKSIMNFKWSLPPLKLPRIGVKGGFSLNPPSTPKFSLEWFAKGGILTQPTVFGANGNNLMAGGEAGKEAVLPLNAETLGGIGRGIANATGFGNMANIESLLKRLIASNDRPVVVMLPNGQVIFESIKNYSDQWTSSTVDWTERGLTI